jgi:hypothetical protein
MNYKTTITYIILTIFSCIMYYLNWIVWILEFILSLLIYTIFFFFLHNIWSKIRKKESMDSKKYIQYFLYRVSILLLFFTLLIWWLSYLSNEIYPASMPEYTISNWDKTIKFQAMSHIWTQNFYNTVKQNLIKYKKQWAVYFFEWVKPWKKVNLEKFNNAIWVKFDKDLYKNFSKLYWVTNQNNNLFLGQVNNLDFNVDINIDQIIDLYEIKISNKKIENKKTNLPIDANKEIINTLSQLNEKELKILVYINQAILNFIISNETTQSFLTENFSNKELFEVILWERNKVIANEIIKSKYKKIYTTYWLLHFKWVLKLLQEHDPKWQIIGTKYLYPIKK